MRTLFLLTTLLFIIPNMFGQKEYRLNSPDGKLEVTLYIGDRITYELTEEGQGPDARIRQCADPAGSLHRRAADGGRIASVCQ